MKKQLKKLLSIVLALCLMLSAVPVMAAEESPTAAAPEIPTEPEQSLSPEETLTPETAEEVTVLWEDESLRGEYEKHFLMSDGSYQAVVYSYPVHELVDGVWVELPAPQPTARGDVSPGNAQSNIIDNYVWEGHGVQDNNSVRLYIGKKSGYKARAFIRFATMPTIPAGATITAATMTVNITSGTSTANAAMAYQVDGPWESATIQWSNMPELGTPQAFNISHNNKTKYQFSCLEAVKEWYTGSTTGQNRNYGIMLCYADETIVDYNSFYSADCTDANSRPSMVISYTPMNSTYELDIGSTMHLFVTGVSEGITWTSSEPAVASVNSNGVVTGIQVGTATITASVGDEVLRVIKCYVTFADGVYRITNTAGFSLGTSGSIAENTLAKMKVYSNSGYEKLYQLWKLKHLGNGYYSIRPVHKLDMGLHAAGTMGSSVDIVSIGTSDTLSDVPSLCRWGISPTLDGNSYFVNHVGTGSLGMTMDGQVPSIDMGVITNISSNTQGYFKWMLTKVEDPPSGAILYDTSTNYVVTNPTRYIAVGETKSLFELNLQAVSYSASTNSASFTWTSSNTSVATVNSSTGTVTGVAYGSTLITASITIAGKTYYQFYTLGVSEIAVSGWELEYEPELWNYSPVQENTNCYAYALNNQVHSGDNTLWYMQPGEAAGYTLTRNSINADTVIAYVEADAAVLGFTFEEIDRDEYCSSGSYKVALVIAPGQDYHWYRQNPDGTWSHKLGWYPVTIEDAENNIIVDPETADRHHSVHYSLFAGYFEVTPLNNMYSTSLSTLSVDKVDYISIEENKSILPSNLEASTIHQGMTYSEVTQKIGLPQRQITYGLRVVEYALSDGNFLTVEYVMQNGQLIVYSCTIEGGINCETS